MCGQASPAQKASGRPLENKRTATPPKTAGVLGGNTRSRRPCARTRLTAETTPRKALVALTVARTATASEAGCNDVSSIAAHARSRSCALGGARLVARTTATTA